jgi:hypothetical protein
MASIRTEFRMGREGNASTRTYGETHETLGIVRCSSRGIEQRRASRARRRLHLSRPPRRRRPTGQWPLRLSRDAVRERADPAPAAAPITLYGVEVSDGQFSTEIDFAENLAPDGWLGVAVRKAGDGDFVDLAGRTEIAAADACWSTTGNVLGSAGGFIGTNDAQPLLMRVNNHFGAGIRTYDNPAATTGVSFEVGNATASAARSVALNWGLANAVDSFAGGYSGQVLAGHDRSFVWGGTNQVSRVSSTGSDEFDIWADGGFNAHTGPFRVWTYGGFLINTTVWNDGDDLVIAPQPLPSPDRDVDVRLRTRSDKNGLIRVATAAGRWNCPPRAACASSDR